MGHILECSPPQPPNQKKKKAHQKENKVFKLTEHNYESLCKFQSVKVDQITVQFDHDYLKYSIFTLKRKYKYTYIPRT